MGRSFVMSKPELKAKPKAKPKMEFWTPTEKENTKDRTSTFR